MWIPLSNKQFRNNHRKHHNVQCPLCSTKTKSIQFHYKINHPEMIAHLNSSFYNEVSELKAVRFIETKALC